MTEYDRVECLIFDTPVGTFAVETGRLRELVELDDVTPVPGSSQSVAGITTLRGTVVVVLSGRTLLDTDEELLLVFDREDDRRPVGLSVGDVDGVVAVGTNSIISPDAFDGQMPETLPLKAVVLPIGRSDVDEPTFVLDTAALGESVPDSSLSIDT